MSNPTDKHQAGEQQPSTENSNMMDRREAMRRLIMTTAYVVPTATMLLSGANEASAGGPPSGFIPE